VDAVTSAQPLAPPEEIHPRQHLLPRGAAVTPIAAVASIALRHDGRRRRGRTQVRLVAVTVDPLTQRDQSHGQMVPSPLTMRCQTRGQINIG
jgi:hypothetical protein